MTDRPEDQSGWVDRLEALEANASAGVYVFQDVTLALVREAKRALELDALVKELGDHADERCAKAAQPETLHRWEKIGIPGLRRCSRCAAIMSVFVPGAPSCECGK